MNWSRVCIGLIGRCLLTEWVSGPNEWVCLLFRQAQQSRSGTSISLDTFDFVSRPGWPSLSWILLIHRSQSWHCIRVGASLRSIEICGSMLTRPTVRPFCRHLLPCRPQAANSEAILSSLITMSAPGCQLTSTHRFQCFAICPYTDAMPTLRAMVPTLVIKIL
jgi:hypothetical protein